MTNDPPHIPAPAGRRVLLERSWSHAGPWIESQLLEAAGPLGFSLPGTPSECTSYAQLTIIYKLSPITKQLVQLATTATTGPWAGGCKLTLPQWQYLVPQSGTDRYRVAVAVKTANVWRQVRIMATRGPTPVAPARQVGSGGHLSSYRTQLSVGSRPSNVLARPTGARAGPETARHSDPAAVSVFGQVMRAE